MDQFKQANQQHWNRLTPQHAKSEFYDLAGFKAGKNKLRSIELAEVGDVAGKSLLHLQCHFGMDTMSWARLGATVTGVDISDEAINLARSLSAELNIPATFVCSDIDDLPNAMAGQFDIVFTSYGVLGYLPDLKRWAEGIAHFLKPGGIFYIVENHPIMGVFEDEDPTELRVAYPYFDTGEAERLETRGSYAVAATDQTEVSYLYTWTHSLSDIINAIVSAGLRIEFLHEFPFVARKRFPFMERGEDGWWRFTKHHNMIPLLFSLKATK